MSQAFTLWFTGMSGAGKSTLSALVAQEMRNRGEKVEVLDGDEVRTHLSKGLGFSKEDRDTNIRRIGYVCKLLTRNGVWAVSAAISPYRATRDAVRKDIGCFIEIHVDCPVEKLKKRDVKGLYKKAKAGKVKNFTGVSDPYEPPLKPEILVNSGLETVQQSFSKIIGYLEMKGYLEQSVRT